jgi:hypothetical protein
LEQQLFVLVSVFPQFFLAFMGGNFSQFTFSSAGHLTLLCIVDNRAAQAAVGIMLHEQKKVKHGRSSAATGK